MARSPSPDLTGVPFSKLPFALSKSSTTISYESKPYINEYFEPLIEPNNIEPDAQFNNVAKEELSVADAQFNNAAKEESSADAQLNNVAKEELSADAQLNNVAKEELSAGPTLQEDSDGFLEILHNYVVIFGDFFFK